MYFYLFFNINQATLLQKDYDMDKINELLNHQLPQNFSYEDDFVMDKLARCIEKLSTLKLDPSVEPIPTNELPQMPFGAFKPSTALTQYQASAMKAPAGEQLRQLADADQQKRKQQQQVYKHTHTLFFSLLAVFAHHTKNSRHLFPK